MKRIISVLSILVLVFALVLPQQIHAEKIFSDEPIDIEQRNAVYSLVDKGVINGYPDGTFKPNQSITRAQVAVMINRAVKLEPVRGATTFSDVPTTHPYYNDIQALYRAGIIDGSAGKYNPSNVLTRGQMAKILANTYKLTLKETNAFTDVSANHGFNKYIGALADANITTGYADGTFKPNTKLSRVHFAVFMYRAIQFIENPNQLKVHFIDVGQGDSILIQAPNGKTMLVDGGVKSAGNTIVSYIQSLGIKKLDYVVATHPDSDHIGGLIAVLKVIPVGEFINSGKDHTTETYTQLLELVLDKNIKYTEPTTGDLIALDKDLKTQVLHVDANTSNNNDASIVLKVTYNKVSFLLMADADTNIESQIASKYDVSATILKAGHHGSNTSSSLTFLQKVKPAATILSYGKDNSYGHPHDEVVANLKAVGSKMYSTAESSTITVTTNGSNYSTSAKPFTGSTDDVNSGIYVIPGAPTSFPNCTAMREYYPNGVYVTHPAYDKKHDRDGDNWACEK